MAYLSPIAQKDVEAPVKLTPKREFEKLIRDIRRIASNSRAFSGDLINELIKQTESSAKKQEAWSLFGSLIQIAIPVISAGWAGSGQTPEEASQRFQMGAKIGDVFQSALGLQYDYQANQQRVNQALSQYQSFESRMQSLIQNIDSAQQRVQQAEMDQAR